MNTEVLCRSSACATSYKLHIASVYQSLDPLILFSNQAQLPYIFEIKSFINQFVDQNVEITQGHLKQVIQLVQIVQYFMNSSVGPRNEENTNASELPKFVK
ncbi:Hypothetical_protein [Hexamita inflata]|uniref:Hypothetical_protein n=1 Tax=Hexamita inflata TaxID=28002 RepID=A0AA86R694_9EUKA|nr:Hypothetical protein HINF_LOCUS50365 [Hexamita inflata]